MAEVLAPISSNTMSILHNHQDAFQTPSNQGNRQTQPRNSMYNPQLSAMGYRGQNLTIAPYQFQNTQARKQDRRKSAGPVLKHSLQQPMPPYHESSSSAASSASSSSNQSGNYVSSKDDSVLGYHQPSLQMHNKFSANSAASLSVPDLSIGNNQFARPSPDRYRRNSRQGDVSLQAPEYQRPVRPVSAPIPVYNVAVPVQSFSGTNPTSPLRSSPLDDGQSGLAANSARYKRRSVASMAAAPPLAHRSASTPVGANGPSWSQVVAGRHSFQNGLPPPQHTSRPQHARSNSGEVRTQGMRPASARHSSYGPSKTPNMRPTTAPNPFPRPRSILGTPVNSAPSVPHQPSTTGRSSMPGNQAPRTNMIAGTKLNDELKSAPAPSPAVQQLAALNQKSNQKGVKSRLRRAFSFSSSSELRKATAENNLAAERAKLRKEKFEGEADRDAIVAAEQEANGLGNDIYSGQGQFINSTDNLSMASTASSASMMLRSIGRGMKKSSRNLRGLFRPKSMIGTPTSDDALDQSSAQVSHVNVEAVREVVNVNVNPHDMPGGGTGYPKLERNSVEAMSDVQSQASGSRKSIVGGDRDRAEVLAAVRKGILKRSGTSSTSSSPVLPQDESPLVSLPGQHSAPGTPAARTSTESHDGYFSGQATSASTRSLPTQGARNVSFGQRVQFFDVWSPTEYDRRGDVATCNRLTPMLAQQIKEELNSFKMEMEVHEKSKPHTHFF